MPFDKAYSLRFLSKPRHPKTLPSTLRTYLDTVIISFLSGKAIRTKVGTIKKGQLQAPVTYQQD